MSSGGGSTSLQALLVAGAGTFAGTTSTTGAATFASTASVAGTLTAQGNAVLGTSSSNTLTVNSAATLQAAVSATGAVTVAGLLTPSGGITAIGGPLPALFVDAGAACSHLMLPATLLLPPSHLMLPATLLLPCSGAAGTNTFGSGSGSTTAFTVYSAATMGASGTTNALTVNSPTTFTGQPAGCCMASPEPMHAGPAPSLQGTVQQGTQVHSAPSSSSAAGVPACW